MLTTTTTTTTTSSSSSSFCDYRFYVDSTLIRVYPKKVGILYPNIGPMAVYCTLYDGSDWATNGGKTEVDWSNAPFVASYKNFYIDACEWSSSSSIIKTSSSSNPARENPIPFCGLDQKHLWWDGPNYRKLDAAALFQLDTVRSSFMIYDYCLDVNRYPTTPAECMWGTNKFSYLSCPWDVMSPIPLDNSVILEERDHTLNSKILLGQ